MKKFLVLFLAAVMLFTASCGAPDKPASEDAKQTAEDVKPEDDKQTTENAEAKDAKENSEDAATEEASSEEAPAEDAESEDDKQASEDKKQAAEDQKKDAEQNDEPLKVVLLINSVLGDKSYLDSAANGIKMINEKYPEVKTDVIEMGYDNSKWEPALMDVCEEDWDIIISGQFSMKEYVQSAAEEFPDKKFIIFDTSVDYDKGDYSNVYSVEFKTNEATFLAGFLAEKLKDDETINPKGEANIGFMGGQDIPLINDFLLGYIQGAQKANPDAKISVSYVGSFRDSAKGKEIALSQYNMGSYLVFPCAGQAGLGALDAANDSQKYAIGVDADQYELFADSDKEKADYILTSVLKRLDVTLLKSIERHMEGTLPYGEKEMLGLKEEAVGLAKNENFKRLVSEDIQDEITQIEEQITSGEIKVDSALGLSTDEMKEIIESVRP